MSNSKFIGTEMLADYYSYSWTNDIDRENDDADFPILPTVKVYNMKSAIISAGYPIKTFGDAYDYRTDTDEVLYGRAKRLSKCGTGEGHDNFLSGIVVAGSLSVPLKALVQLERYHFFQIVSCTSTMHRGNTGAGVFTNYTPYESMEAYDIAVCEYNETPTPYTKNAMLDSIPGGWYYQLGFVTNYLQLKTIYKQRRNHQYEWWQEFCDEIEALPYSEFITGRYDEL